MSVRDILDSPTWQLLDGGVVEANCMCAFATIPDQSVDAVCTDPPYGIGFMGKDWDSFRPEQVAKRQQQNARKGTERRSAQYPDRVGSSQGGGVGIKYDESLAGNQRFQAWMTLWAEEALRILKPGGHLLAFGGTRTSHRLACAIEDAGFEIRDSLLWMFGSGFPKSLDVSKAIDKAQGAEGHWRQEDHPGRAGPRQPSEAGGAKIGQIQAQRGPDEEGLRHVYEPSTDAAKEWEGWGTALKPAHEPIVVARKPLAGTVAANILEFGTGGINVDGCRIKTDEDDPNLRSNPTKSNGLRSIFGVGDVEYRRGPEESGRWPANVVLSHTCLCGPVGTRIIKGDPRETGEGKRPGGFADIGAENGDGKPNAAVYGNEEVVEWDCAPGCPVAALDAQTGNLQSGFMAAGTQREGIGYRGGLGTQVANDTYGDAGGASRFFYCAKTSRAERNAGLDEFEKRPLNWSSGDQSPGTFQAEGTERAARNSHPTVKPINLMRWLVRLVTPPGGIVLDPFVGSGSTGCAAVLEGFDFVGIEREAEYVAIAEARIKWWAEHRGREAEEVLADHGRSERETQKHVEAGQLGLELT